MTIIERPSPNFSPRSAKKIDLVVIHSTEGSMPGCLEWLTSRAAQASSHYLIARDGSVYRLVAESAKAWHAGQSIWRGRSDVNQFSIGIELEDVDEADAIPFTDAQYAALAELVRDIRVRHGPIPCAGHSDVSPGRKLDPGPLFEWSRVPQQEPFKEVRWRAPVRILLADPDETLGEFLERILTT